MEELMLQDLTRLRSLLWIITQHPLHQTDGFRRRTRHDGLQIDLLVLWQSEQLAVSQAPCIRPVIRVGLAQNHTDFLELVHLRRPREEGLERVQLRHNAPQCKDIHWIVIRPAA